LEVDLTPETPLGTLAAQGVTVSEAVCENGRMSCTVELSPETDVRRVADAVTHEYDGQVTAKRRRERELTTPQEFRAELSDRLTDKQETALRTAFFADYFESPRGSTAEEVATTLDITGPTLLHHLRAGQRKLLSEFFETTDRT
jgi:predicted DNA binding protein